MRQLHIYDFHKTSTLDPNHVGYANEFFRRDKPDLLTLIKRKANPHQPKASAPVVHKPTAAVVPHHHEANTRSTSRIVPPTTSVEPIASLPPQGAASSRKAVGASVHDELHTLRVQNQTLQDDFEQKWDMLESYLMSQLNDHENRMNDLKAENRRLREVIGSMKTSQKKVLGQWEKLMQSVYGLFTPPGPANGAESSTAPINWANFDYSNFHTLMSTATHASQAFYTSIESDARDVLSLTHSPANRDVDFETDPDFSSLLTSPRELPGLPATSDRHRREGQPLSYSFSFDTAASRIAAPVAPPVPKYTESSPKESVGGEAMTRQSSFELFSNYVSMFGKPIETVPPVSSAATEGASPLKRPLPPIEEKDDKDAKAPKTSGEDEVEDQFAQPPPQVDLNLSGDSRFNSLDFSASPHLSLSRLNSLDFAFMSRSNSAEMEPGGEAGTTGGTSN